MAEKKARSALSALVRGVRRTAPLLLAAGLLILMVTFGLRGQGPFGRVGFLRRLGGHEETTAASTPTTTAAAADGSGTTTTTFELLDVDYDAGSCITWDQGGGLGGERHTREVPCDQPHLFETTSSFEIDGSGYADDGPTDEQWHAVSQGECLHRAEQFLGYPLDLSGRFEPNEIKPLPEGWRSGDRTVWCGMVVDKLAPTSNPYDFLPFTGPVEGADQTLLYGYGTCIDASGWTVPCTVAHDVEVVGTATVGTPGQPYPGPDAISSQSHAACTTAAQGVYGGPLAPGVIVGNLHLDESSWNIGRRVVECLLGLAGPDDQWQASSVPVRR